MSRADVQPGEERLQVALDFSSILRQITSTLALRIEPCTAR